MAYQTKETTEVTRIVRKLCFYICMFAGLSTSAMAHVYHGRVHHRQHEARQRQHEATQIAPNNLRQQVGFASWYGPHMSRYTANFERFRPNDLTCAHRTLPFNTIVKVTDLSNGSEIFCRVNDRGPYARHRILDLSKGSAHALGMKGVDRVAIEVAAAP
jgi:rare lipoprotein A